ncbi:hypothetical protein FRC14_003829 [Serendipita sp. 396]|nr:hypothetical protein FRC14_003829 [Serendipita sp. 396]KAG8789434.1 hypothetical protein FRC15_008291 [Serendipita sp. 397]KAG8804667.1 hypothetical protein FRC16_003557 [Serendipita sp. 398]KAG8823742.1 hypothetical protein FRC19_003255 [Serendipita sp. 401]KAG8847897.1 hypothetical protein FRB91_011345 [Serendipita sp. 411]KAG8879018.1 hypothetical protein FRC20_003777 [Serendipita sp. 405]KAG9054371.1 hypothetical protein FS842_005344 [Serendipita sp. 407]
MSNLEHSTTQAHEQPQNPGTPPNEHPYDLKSRPNDAHNQHQAADSGLDDMNYPPQLHAGKVGLGPHYAEQNQATFTDETRGIKEIIKGKLKRDHDLEQQGHDRFTGDLKRRERQKEVNEPFAENTDKKDQGENTTDKKDQGGSTADPKA